MTNIIEGELIVADSKELQAIVKKINSSYKKASDHINQAMKYSIDVGNYLIEAKEEVPHGEWENWVKTTVQLSFSSSSQAKSYMRLAKDSNLALLVNDGTIEGTLKLMKDATLEQLEEAAEMKAEDDTKKAEAAANKKAEDDAKENGKTQVSIGKFLADSLGVNENTGRKFAVQLCEEVGIEKTGNKWMLTAGEKTKLLECARGYIRQPTVGDTTNVEFDALDSFINENGLDTLFAYLVEGKNSLTVNEVSKAYVRALQTINGGHLSLGYTISEALPLSDAVWVFKALEKRVKGKYTEENNVITML